MKTSAALQQTSKADAAFRKLVHSGILAPSGDNLQPWRFEAQPHQGKIVVHVDEDRDRSPMNSGQRMSRIAVGAAVENVIQTAERNHLNCQVESIESSCVVLSIETPIEREIEIPEVIADRCTNRRLYDAAEADSREIKTAVEAVEDLDGVRVNYVKDRSQIQRLAAVIRRSDALLFGNAVFRSAFLENVRLDLPPAEVAEEGLGLATLEAGGFDRFALRLLSKTPALLADRPVGSGIGKQSEKLVRSASGLCIGIAGDAAAETDFRVGRAMERTWLTLTRHRLSAQPMMSLLVLQGAVQHAPTHFSRPRDISAIKRLENEIGAVIGEASNARIAFILRFGSALPPTGRSGRRKDLRAVLRNA